MATGWHIGYRMQGGNSLMIGFCWQEVWMALLPTWYKALWGSAGERSASRQACVDQPTPAGAGTITLASGGVRNVRTGPGHGGDSSRGSHQILSPFPELLCQHKADQLHASNFASVSPRRPIIAAGLTLGKRDDWRPPEAL